MARRSKLETSIIHYLKGHGWRAPSLRLQSTALPGITPAQASDSGKGRGPVLFDIEKVDDSSGIVTSIVAGLKASGDRRTTIDITTGRPEHIEAVVSAAQRGLSLPIVVIAMKAEIEEISDNLRIISHGEISACCVNVGECIRAHGLRQRTQGQGKGRGESHPISWGEKRQTAKSGKTYVYVSLQAHLAGCGAKWETFKTLSDLADYIEGSSEAIYL